MDIFDAKTLTPMLIADKNNEPFDSPDYIFELKLDGGRCLPYLDTNSTALINKRRINQIPQFPELSDIHKQVKKKCILDGEIIVMKNGKPNFYEYQPRTIMSDAFKIKMAAAAQLPASFIAYDILYVDGEQITHLPLLERKKILQDVIIESDKLSVSRYIHENGIALYELVQQQELEGIVAKKANSIYYPGRETKDWKKIKYLMDDDYVILGYSLKESSFKCLALGQYENGVLVFVTHITTNISKDNFRIIESQNKLSAPPCPVPTGYEGTVWLNPELVCTISFMQKTESGALRQAGFKGLRFDKEPQKCVK